MNQHKAHIDWIKINYLERFKVFCTAWYQDPGDRYTWSGDIFFINPICAEIFSHPIGAGGGSHLTPPPYLRS